MEDFPVKNPFGGIDEQISQELFEQECGGVARATQLLNIWKDSYPKGTLYDKNFTGRYMSKGEVFVKKAMAADFTETQIDMFLSL